jgi:hypothetical protein
MPMDHGVTRRRLLALGLAAAGSQVLEPAPALAKRRGPRADTVVLHLPRAKRIGPVHVPGGLDLAGLRWPGAHRVRAHIRGRTRRGWTDWLPLGAPHGPAPHGTDPVWLGRVRQIELRLDHPVHGLHLHGIRVTPARLHASARAAQAQPGAPPVRIITRDEWGADQVPPRAAPQFGEVRMAFVHHTVNSNDYAPEDSPGIVLAIAKYHRNSNRWNDIGYNFLVDRFGQVFEGRAGGIDQAVIGAQAQGYNTYSTGVASIGTHDVGGLTEPALDALTKLVAWKLAIHGAPVEGDVTIRSAGGEVNRYPSGRDVVFARISGHRDGDKTECPGDALYAQLPDIRLRAAEQQRALGGPRPAGPGGPAVVLTLASSRIVLPDAGQALGVVTGDGGAPLANTPISVQFQATTGRWITISRSRTGDDGRYGAPIPVHRNVRVRVQATSGATKITSPVLPLTVVPRLQARTARRRIKAGRKIRVSVDVTPYRPRVNLVLARQLPNGSYVPAGVVRARVRGHLAQATIRLRRPGLYRIIAQAPADRHALASSAPWVFVRAIH